MSLIALLVLQAHAQDFGYIAILQQSRAAIVGKDYKTAKTLLTAAEAAAPSSTSPLSEQDIATLWFYRGLIEWRAGDKDSAALNHWRQALVLAPHFEPDKELLPETDGQDVLYALASEVANYPQVAVNLPEDPGDSLIFIDGRRLEPFDSVPNGRHLVQIRCGDGNVVGSWYTYGAPPADYLTLCAGGEFAAGKGAKPPKVDKKAAAVAAAKAAAAKKAEEEAAAKALADKAAADKLAADKAAKAAADKALADQAAADKAAKALADKAAAEQAAADKAAKAAADKAAADKAAADKAAADKAAADKAAADKAAADKAAAAKAAVDKAAADKAAADKAAADKAAADKAAADKAAADKAAADKAAADKAAKAAADKALADKGAGDKAAADKAAADKAAADKAAKAAADKAAADQVAADRTAKAAADKAAADKAAADKAAADKAAKLAKNGSGNKKSPSIAGIGLMAGGGALMAAGGAVNFLVVNPAYDWIAAANKQPGSQAAEDAAVVEGQFTSGKYATIGLVGAGIAALGTGVVITLIDDDATIFVAPNGIGVTGRW